MTLARYAESDVVGFERFSSHVKFAVETIIHCQWKLKLVVHKLTNENNCDVNDARHLINLELPVRPMRAFRVRSCIVRALYYLPDTTTNYILQARTKK